MDIWLEFEIVTKQKSSCLEGPQSETYRKCMGRSGTSRQNELENMQPAACNTVYEEPRRTRQSTDIMKLYVMRTVQR